MLDFFKVCSSKRENRSSKSKKSLNCFYNNSIVYFSDFAVRYFMLLSVQYELVWCKIIKKNNQYVEILQKK